MAFAVRDAVSTATVTDIRVDRVVLAAVWRPS
jgi:hypothetical protein